jgi:hypothetical protein
LLQLAGLDRGFLIGANHPDTLSQQVFGPIVQLQDRARPLQESLQVVNVLPGMQAPGLQLIGGKPALQRAGRNADHQAEGDQASGDL